ncbi:MAG: OadG family transporter subunit [Bacillota bacterium]
MSGIVSIRNSLLITFFSMAVVFASLVAISCLIEMLRALTNRKEDGTTAETGTESAVIVETEEILSNEELAAVIAAAIAACIGAAIPQLRVAPIKRVPQAIPTWSWAGRIEQEHLGF